MKIEYDQEVDSLYIRLQEKEVSNTKALGEGINFDTDNEGRLIGLEIIGALERYQQKDILNISTESLSLEKAA